MTSELWAVRATQTEAEADLSREGYRRTSLGGGEWWVTADGRSARVVPVHGPEKAQVRRQGWSNSGIPGEMSPMSIPDGWTMEYPLVGYRAEPGSLDPILTAYYVAEAFAG